ncbi:hypothetical protein EV1_025753 [Malus domestica]
MKFPGTYITPNGVFSIARKSRDVSSRSICPRRTTSWSICPKRTTSYSHPLRDLSGRTISIGMSIARRSAYSGNHLLTYQLRDLSSGKSAQYWQAVIAGRLTQATSSSHIVDCK